MRDKTKKYYSISPANARMFDILAEFEQQKRNASDYICKAVMEKYDREKSAVSAEDMLKTLMAMLGNNNIQIPVNQQAPVQPSLAPIQQPTAEQEIKNIEAVETKQDNTGITTDKEEIIFVPKNPIEALIFQD